MVRECLDAPMFSNDKVDVILTGGGSIILPKGLGWVVQIFPKALICVLRKTSLPHRGQE